MNKRPDALAKRIQRDHHNATEAQQIASERLKNWNFGLREQWRYKESERKSVFDDWSKRRYGNEELPWFAALLRIALPEELDGERRFHEMPSALKEVGAPWSHVVIDDAQDLNVAEAFLLGSLSSKNGALTVAADFRQRVAEAY